MADSDNGAGDPAMDTKQALISALHTACEVEHQFMCMYLFSAYSMKKRYVPEQSFEDISDAQLETVRRWISTVYLVARQEMEHLAIAQNLVTAVGGTPNFGRDNMPDNCQEKPALLADVHLGAERFGNCDDMEPIDQPFCFTPFDWETVKRWTCMEAPGCEALMREQPGHFADWCFRKKAMLAAATPEHIAPGEIVTIYDHIERLFEALPPSAYVANDSSQPKIIQQYDIYVFPVVDLASAKQGIDLITKQGEGNKASTQYESHYRRFYDIASEYQAMAQEAQKQGKDFKPYWDLESVSGSDQIGNRFTAGCFDLYNHGYQILVTMLTGLYATYNQQPGSYPHFAPALGQESFAPYMTMVIRSLAEVLVQLRMSDDTACSRRVGPSFYLPADLIADLREPVLADGSLKPRFGDINQIIDQTVAFNAALDGLIEQFKTLSDKGQSPVIDSALQAWAGERLEYIQSNAQRITVNLRRIYQQGIYSALDTSAGY